MRRLADALPVVLALGVAACGDDTPPPASPPDGPPTFTVMTQNLYLGGDLDLAFAPGANLPEAVELIWSSVQATRFADRAQVIAATIEANAPDLIGLQEAALWRTQTPGDRLPIPDATAVAEDFLDTLVMALAARGLTYQVAATIQNGDVELPGASGTDYRLTDRDVVLVKTSMTIVAVASGTFPHLASVELPSPIGGTPIRATIPRGWVSVGFRAGGRTVRLVNTHLEAFSADVAAQQALDLIAAAVPAGQPAVVLGDMNLAPGSAGYGNLVTGTGLADAWSALHASDPGLTCCWNPDLRGGAFQTRIDLVFTSGDLRPTSARKVDETERTATGLAPSDHAGLVVEVTTQ